MTDKPLITVPALSQNSNSMSQANVSNQRESSAHEKPRVNSQNLTLVLPTAQAEGVHPTKFKASSRDNVRTKAFARYQALGFSREYDYFKYSLLIPVLSNGFCKYF